MTESKTCLEPISITYKETQNQGKPVKGAYLRWDKRRPVEKVIVRDQVRRNSIQFQTKRLNLPLES